MQTTDQAEEAQTRRRKRCYHRVISGLEKGGELRLVTLTSSDDAPCDIQQSFRKLMMRLTRRQLVNGYLKVIEVKTDGRQHIHMCFRGSFIEQTWLSNLWAEIHLSPIVDIRRVKTGYQNKRGVAGYLAKYMSKEGFRRYSWSWGWVYKGFVGTWTQAKAMIYHRLPDTYLSDAWYHLRRLWRVHVKTNQPPDIYLGILEYTIDMLKRQQPATVTITPHL